MDLNIAFLQLLPGKTQEENLEKGLQACREAKERGADIALFPEIWNIWGSDWILPIILSALDRFLVFLCC